MDLRELRLVLARHLPISILVFACCVSVGIAAAFVPEKQYRATATISIGLAGEGFGGQSLQQTNFLLPAVREKAESRSLQDRAATGVDQEFRLEPVRISASSQASVLRLEGSGPDPVATQSWVNATANRLIDEDPDDSALSMSILDEALVPRKPVSPNVAPTMLTALVVGLILGVFSALLADRLEHAFDTGAAVRERLGTTILGEIPMARGGHRRPVVELLQGEHQDPHIIAAFESIRTNVELRMAREVADRVAVISYSGGAGRSTVSAGLAFSMAQVGRETAVIDADLRRPGLARQLGVKPTGRIGDESAFSIDSIELQATTHERLKFVPARLLAGRPADILTTTLPLVLDAVDNGGRMIVIDSSPLRGAPESSVVIYLARHVVLVVSADSVNYSELAVAIERIQEAGGVLVGVVLNRVSLRRAKRNEYVDDFGDIDPTDSVRASQEQPSSSDLGGR